jgi:hypothetical protein
MGADADDELDTPIILKSEDEDVFVNFNALDYISVPYHRYLAAENAEEPWEEKAEFRKTYEADEAKRKVSEAEQISLKARKTPEAKLKKANGKATH